MSKWKFNPESSEGAGDAQILDGSVMVVAIDSISPKVAEKIVELFNLDDNAPEKRVETYLEETSMCSVDEKEFLMEQIEHYMKTRETVALNSVVNDLINLAMPITSQVATIEQPKKESPLKGKPRNVVTANSKSLTPDEAIAAMEERIALLKWFKGVVIPEVPTEGLSTLNKKLLSEFSKQHENLVSDYVQRVQNN
jgi:hypothetical protein